jgi:carboxylesterase 2
MSQMNASSIAELRDLPVSTLMIEDNVSDTILEQSIYANVSGFGEPPEWRPVIDGYVLPSGYEEALLARDHWDIPVLTGNNKDEDGASTNPHLTVEEFRTQFALMFGDMSGEFFELYPAENDTAAGIAANSLWNDMTRLGMWQWARDWRLGGAKSSTFTYFYTHAPPNQTSGAYHGSELYYVFNNIPYTDPSKTWTLEEYRVGDTMVTYWANFIKTGNPNGHGLAHWPANNDHQTIMFLGDSWGEEPVASNARIAFLEKFLKTQQAW